MNSDEYALITVIMPIRNEAAFIRRSIGMILNQDNLEERMEVIVVDGMSTDGTREIIQQIIEERRQKADEVRQTNNSSFSVVHSPPSIISLDNPGRIVPTGLNLALRAAKGEVIIRVDGHCKIAQDYICRCVELLEQTGSDCVGGSMITVGETWTARSIALAQSSSFGVGGVAFRTGRSKPGYVDTVAFGAYRREVFDRIGGFDEELVRNQDDEFNFRLIQAGGKIWLDPSIRSTYYSRANLRSLSKQYFEYGLYKVRVIQKRRAVPSWRHIVPGAFLLGLLLAVSLALTMSEPFWFLVVVGPYAAANLFASLWTARRDLRLLPILPLAFSTLHLSYGIGFLWGLWKWRNKWSEPSGLTFPIDPDSSRVFRNGESI